MSRTIYLLVLLGLALLGLRFLIGFFLYWHAPGVVDLGQIQVGAERAGRVAALQVVPGQRVQAGQVLAVVAVPAEESRATLARGAVERLQAQIRAERDRASARARVQASGDAEEAARLNDRAFATRAEQALANRELESLQANRREIRREIEAYDRLSAQGIVSRTEYLDLRLKNQTVEGRIQGLRGRLDVLEQKVRHLDGETARLAGRMEVADRDAEKASAVAALEAQLAEARRTEAHHHALGRHEITAPCDGSVAWIECRVGEVLPAGGPVLQLVPESPPVILAYPGDDLPGFSPGVRVRAEAAGFEAEGTVVRVAHADRPRPVAMLNTYEREAVGPVVEIRVDRILEGAPRAGTLVDLSVPRITWLRFWPF